MYYYQNFLFPLAQSVDSPTLAGTTQNELNQMKNAMYNCKDIVCISLLFYITVCTFHYCVHRFNQGGVDVVEHYWKEMKTESCLFQTVCFHLVKMCDKKITQVICAAVQRPGWIRGGRMGLSIIGRKWGHLLASRGGPLHQCSLRGWNYQAWNLLLQLVVVETRRWGLK